MTPAAPGRDPSSLPWAAISISIWGTPGLRSGATTAFGLQLVGGYEYHFREGEKSVLQWMPTITADGPKAILPNAKQVDEHRHLLRLDARYDWRQWQFSDALRYEFYELDTHRPFVVAGFPSLLPISE
jgi:hypothetical protein